MLREPTSRSIAVQICTVGAAQWLERGGLHPNASLANRYAALMCTHGVRISLPVGRPPGLMASGPEIDCNICPH
ncbi:hypothetical protein J1614_011915 [Plenodomus biglobosus]|nr:hypothetical protein J1614_011915 [Plenodomus biglobosus]